MISGPIILFYILVCYWAYKIVFIASERVIFSRVVFVLLLSFPYWDLVIQKGIKTFYQASGLLEPKIYAYPEKDKDGRIESLGLSEIAGIDSELNRDEIIRRCNYYSDGVRDFAEVTLGYDNIDGYYGGKKTKKEIVKLDLLNQTSKIIPKSEARYVFKRTKNNVFFGFGEEIHTSIFDTKTQKVLGEVIYISLPMENRLSFFRNDILLLRSGNGMPMDYVEGSGDYTGRELRNKLKIHFKQGK